ncbi:MAG TPA: molybdenum cofactor guanylyltransferase [Sphingobium sp.]|uniref:molybdenum cofactor guanylyltransferase n=1 Tax=Sphingobium sp. TaxID=1912891 RepID=UPI002ED24041
MEPITNSRIMGAVLAGGLSTRFGSDKALALLGGRSLIDCAVDSLSSQCTTVVIIGREGGAPDWPHSGLGPLGGLAGALRHAQAMEYEAVLSCGVDSVGLPDDLLERLSPAPAYLATQPVIGLWPVLALPTLEAILTGSGKHAVMRFVEAIGARAIDLPRPPANVNWPEDLARLQEPKE